MAGRPRTSKKKAEAPAEEEVVAPVAEASPESDPAATEAEGQEQSSGTTLAEAKGRWLELKRMGMKELVARALELGIFEPRVLRKQALMFAILEKEQGGGDIYAEGVDELIYGRLSNVLA